MRIDARARMLDDGVDVQAHLDATGLPLRSLDRPALAWDRLLVQLQQVDLLKRSAAISLMELRSCIEERRLTIVDAPAANPQKTAPA